MSIEAVDQNRSFTTEDILASLAVLLLAGIFILYQTGFLSVPGEPYVASEIAAPVISAGAVTTSMEKLPEAGTTPAMAVAEPPVVEKTAIRKAPVEVPVQAAAAPVNTDTAMTGTAIANAPVGLSLVDERIAPAVIEQPPAVVETPAPVVQTVEAEPIAPKAEIVAVAPVVTGTPVEPEVKRDIYLERNIETNQIDFSGKVKPATSLRLLINGEASEVFIADKQGQWFFSKGLNEGLYTFELQQLDADGAVADTSAPLYYQVLGLNQSSRDANR